MSLSLLIAVTVAYVGISFSEIYKGNYPTALVFGGYALANVGLMVAL